MIKGARKSQCQRRATLQVCVRVKGPYRYVQNPKNKGILILDMGKCGVQLTCPPPAPSGSFLGPMKFFENLTTEVSGYKFHPGR